MHELPIIREVLKISLEHAEKNNAAQIKSIVLSVGELREVVEEWMQRYFEFAGKGTIAEGAVLRVNLIPVIFHCVDCGENFTFDITKFDDVRCPECNGKRCSIISGNEFFIDSIEIE